jgi:hypothetical protein
MLFQSSAALLHPSHSVVLAKPEPMMLLHNDYFSN